MTPAWVLLPLLLLPLGAQAAKGNRAAEQHLNQGQAELSRGNFDNALRVLDQAANETEDDQLLARIHLLRGQTFAAEQDLDQAEAAFQLALEHDPEASLDPARVDPKLVRMLDGLRERMKGEVNIRAEVPGSRITVDGRYVGQSPVNLNLSIGRHKVEAVTPDGKKGGKTEVVVWAKRVTETQVQEDESRDTGTPKSYRRGFADLRGNWNTFRLLDGLGFEIGGGVEQEYARVSVHLRLFPGLGVTPRGGFHVPITDEVDGLVELELPLLFSDRGVSFGLGGAGGAEWQLSQWVGLFGEVGFRYLLINPDYDPSQLFLQAGVRLRLPR